MNTSPNIRATALSCLAGGVPDAVADDPGSSDCAVLAGITRATLTQHAGRAGCWPEGGLPEGPSWSPCGWSRPRRSPQASPSVRPLRPPAGSRTGRDDTAFDRTAQEMPVLIGAVGRTCARTRPQDRRHLGNGPNLVEQRTQTLGLVGEPRRSVAPSTACSEMPSTRAICMTIVTDGRLPESPRWPDGSHRTCSAYRWSPARRTLDATAGIFRGDATRGPNANS